MGHFHMCCTHVSLKAGGNHAYTLHKSLLMTSLAARAYVVIKIPMIMVPRIVSKPKDLPYTIAQYTHTLTTTYSTLTDLFDFTLTLCSHVI